MLSARPSRPIRRCSIRTDCGSEIRPSTRMSRGDRRGTRPMRSPFGDCDHPCERHAHKDEGEPTPVPPDVLRKNENMDDEPHTCCEPDAEPEQIFGSLVC